MSFNISGSDYFVSQFHKHYFQYNNRVFGKIKQIRSHNADQVIISFIYKHGSNIYDIETCLDRELLIDRPAKLLQTYLTSVQTLSKAVLYQIQEVEFWTNCKIIS